MYDLLSLLSLCECAYGSQVMLLYDEEEQAMKDYFAQNTDLVYACCLDLWKSRVGDHFLGICTNFITEDWKMMNLCLAVKQITRRHTADIIRESTVEVLDNYGIVPKCFVADNASNQVLCNNLLADWSDEAGCLGMLTTPCPRQQPSYPLRHHSSRQGHRRGC